MPAAGTYNWRSSETTNCVMDDKLCRGRQSLSPTTNFMKQKCLGSSTTTNFVVLNELRYGG